jgi:hypothetical protein
MQTSFPIPPAWRWRLGIGLVVTFVFCLWLITFVYHRVAKANFEAHVTELAAKGESLEVDDLRPPPIENPEEDVAAAPVFAEFFERCRRDPEGEAEDPVWGELDLKEVAGFSRSIPPNTPSDVRFMTHHPLSHGFDLPDEEAAARAILAHGEVHSATLSEIREAVTRPKADFHAPYGDFAGAHPGLTGFNAASKFLNRQGRAALLLGQVDLAKSNSIAMLRFSRHLGGEASVIHGLVGNAMQSQAIFVVREGLATGRWREEDLVSTAEELEPRWLEAAFLCAIRMERATAQEFWERAKKDPKMWSTWGDEGVRLFLHLPELRKGWYFDNLEHYNRTMQESILEDADGRIKTNRFSIPLREIPTIHPAGSDVRDQFRFHVENFRHGCAEWMFAVFSGVQTRALRSQVLQDHALIAISLDLHQREHGSFPATLDRLKLPSGSPLPLDPFTGADYLYRPESETDYLLYSPGPNGLDEGGLIRHRDTDGDWVWRLHLPEDFDYDAYRGR